MSRKVPEPSPRPWSWRRSARQKGVVEIVDAKGYYIADFFGGLEDGEMEQNVRMVLRLVNGEGEGDA